MEAVCSVLIVDDESVGLDTLESVFLNQPYRILKASSGAEALEIARRERPHLILLDVMMPGMDGFDVCRLVRAIPELADTPIVLVTALDAEEVRRDGLDAGADDIFTKPIDREMLRRRASAFSELSRHRRATASPRDDADRDARIELAELRADVNDALGSALPLEISLQNCAKAIADRTGVEFVSIWLADESGSSFVARQRHTTLPNDHAEAAERTAFEAALRTGADDHANPTIGVDGNVNYSARPLILDEERVGAIVALGTNPLPSTIETALDLVSTPIVRAIRRVRTATALEQSERTLRQSQKMEVMGRLAGAVAHEINNLLTVVIGYSDLALRRLSANDPIRDDIAEIEISAERGRKLTQQLLTFSREHVRQPEELSLSSIVANLEGTLARLAGDGVELVLHTGSEPWQILADPTQLEQLLLNLAVNAREAMSARGKLTIAVENVRLTSDISNPSSLGGDAVMLSVRDTGCGMDAATIERLFEPFFTTKRPERGTGLGLATSYGIVTQNGGTIEASSELGHGSTFRVFFPRAGGLARRPSPAEPSSMETQSGSAGTVVLVEPEPAIRQLVRNALDAEGYTVVDASDDLDRESTTKRRVDALLAGVGRPGMQCYEFVRRFLAARPDMPVVFLGVHAEDLLPPGRGKARTTFLQKPFRLDALVEAVAAILRTAATDGAA